MKIVLLSAASSIHTVRWANGLSLAGHDVHVISQHKNIDNFISSVSVHLLPYGGTLGYFYIVPAVRKLLKRIQPDIVNAHYASGYGTTAMLVGYRPWLLSIWGSDVYDFPHRTPLHKWLVRRNILCADKTASTSFCMAEETRRLVPQLNHIEITPFGVDVELYANPTKIYSNNKDKIVIGTVKTMSSKYGIDTLIQAYSLLLSSIKNNANYSEQKFELRLVGGGELIPELTSLAEKLGVAKSVSFLGQVHHDQVCNHLSEFDIYVALSRLDSESFGVAIIEAGGAGLPVVVSDAGGLPEVTLEGKTGFVVPREDPLAAARAIEKLVLNPQLRQEMGRAGMEHVSRNYAWDKCVNTMLKVYKKTIAEYQREH